MALQDQIGLTGPQYDVYIERGKIREFARAMGAPLPEFLEGSAPIAPATFLVSAPYTWGYTLERPRGTIFSNIDHDLTVSLHAEESFRYFGPPPAAGDHLIAQPTLEKAWEKRGSSGGKLSFLTILNEYRTPEGTLRAEQRSTSVTTEASPGEGEWKPVLPVYDPTYKELEKASMFSDIKRASFEDLEVGGGPQAITATPLLKQEIVRFQGVVGEDDPLHHDTEWAIKNGYPGVFALGTHQASLMAAYASYWLDPLAVRSFKVRFHDVMWPGDRFTYKGTVDGLDLEAMTTSVHMTCKREDGGLVSEAWSEYDFSQT